MLNMAARNVDPSEARQLPNLETRIVNQLKPTVVRV